MLHMVVPLIFIVVANTVYNICAKSTPTEINSFASLAITYTMAAISAVAMYLATSGESNLLGEFSKANWTSYVLGMAIVGLEFGFLSAYRVGWKISSVQLVSSICVACVLLVVGVIVYKEIITFRQLIGIAISMVGLVLIAK
jgi:uncharacterized membrane protein